jgi:Tfp pilus assembly protein PilF
MLSVRLLPCLFLLLSNVSFAQNEPRGHVSLQVFVYYDETKEPVHDPDVHVLLLDSWSMIVAEQDTKQGGVLQFFTQPGLHYLRVTGDKVEFQEFGFDIRPNESSHTETVYVTAKTAVADRSPATDAVPAVRLKIPKKAKKEFEKGVKALERQDWGEARARFQAAVNEYPQFDLAYNGLGLVALSTGDFTAAEAALELAIKFNDSYADAYRNLARVRLAQNDYVRADPLLQKSLSFDPRSPWALSYAALTELQLGKPDDAIAHTRSLHLLPHLGYASAHLIAARAWEQKGLANEAISEYELYLKEDPAGPNAQRARAAIARISTQQTK